MSQNACFPFLTLEQHTTFKGSMNNRLSNLINCNRSAAKISQVLCSNWYPPQQVKWIPVRQKASEEQYRVIAPKRNLQKKIIVKMRRICTEYSTHDPDCQQTCIIVNSEYACSQKILWGGGAVAGNCAVHAKAGGEENNGSAWWPRALVATPIGFIYKTHSPSARKHTLSTSTHYANNLCAPCLTFYTLSSIQIPRSRRTILT